ncbi:MAG TPA: hypothetical protein VHR84_01730 [Terriglobales bacterium]|nr:hypothetical protein [Terriglobales bacterium]
MPYLSSSVDNTVSNLHVLVIGLDPYRVPGPWNPKPVADAIDIGMTALADRGFYAEACLVGLDGSDDVEARVTAALRARSWDCVVVGGGIRKPEEQLELFESIINLICRHAPQAAIAFNHTPHDLADAAAQGLRCMV